MAPTLSGRGVRGVCVCVCVWERGRGVRNKWDVIGCSGRGGRGDSKCSGSPISFFVKENWICAMTRHQSESNINILLTRNLPFDSDVRQRNHPLMIPLHYL